MLKRRLGVCLSNTQMSPPAVLCILILQAREVDRVSNSYLLYDDRPVLLAELN